MEVVKKVDKPVKKKPFKVCFVDKGVIGRSNIQPDKPLNAVIPLTSKFHINRKIMYCNNLEKIINSLKVQNLHDKYESPITENQRYGWYNLTVENPDRRFYFGKRTDQIIKENIMNFEKIRE